MNNIVVVNNLNVIFGKFYAVKDVSFAVERGEIFGFLGANGAGKTTTIRVLCGLIVPSSGEVLIDSDHFVKGKENLIKQKVGYMSQRFTLYDDLTINENLSFAASLRKIEKAKFELARDRLFEFIDFTQDTDTIVSDLPGGIKQEVALVASILHDPVLIFLDEPTAGVAPAARARFWTLIKKLASIGKTIFVTTHYMDEAENCDRIALMRSGELIALDSPEGLKKSTYKQQIYNITAINKEGLARLKSEAESVFSMFDPYGSHYHAMVRSDLNEQAVLDRLSQYCSIEKIEPSLEDVFVKLVEGDTR